MLQPYSIQIRKTAIIAATALAVALPGAASAGVFDKAKSGVAKVGKSVTSTAVTIVRKKKQVPNPIETVAGKLPDLQNLAGDLPGSELFDMVHELQVIEQLRDTLALVRQTQAGYVDFAGGFTGCKGECKAFRQELKDLFDDMLSLVEAVPALQQGSSFTANIQRLSGLIDYVPPRALFPMWQATGNQIDELRTIAENTLQTLYTLPPALEISMVAPRATTRGVQRQRNQSANPACGWVDLAVEPVVQWIQAELEGAAWIMQTLAGLVPELSVKMGLSAEAGVAVANAGADGAVIVKVSELLRIGFKVAAAVPEGINMYIKVNTARANAVCS